MNQASFRRPTIPAFALLTLGICAAWVPLLGGYQPLADDFPWIKIIREEGLAGYLRRVGCWRPLGQWIPVRLHQWHPWLIPAMSLATHLTATLLFFVILKTMFGGRRLPVFIAMIFGMFPLCYEAQTWMLALNYELLLPQFLAGLLLLLPGKSSVWPVGLRVGLLFGLALSANLTNESLFFSIIFSGVVALQEENWRVASGGARTLAVASAPAAGCVAWYALTHFFAAPEMPKKMGFHLASLFSPYLRAGALLDALMPWASPVTRGLLGSSWQGPTALAAWGCAALFVAACVVFSFAEPPADERVARRRFPVFPLLILIMGSSLVYVFAGGFSLDSRKRYVTFPLWLLGVAWVYRAAARDRRVSHRIGLGILLAAGMAGCASTWLVIDVWKHETARHNALAQFIVDKKISGEIEVRWNPDIYRAWPQFGRTLGYRLDDDWVLDLAVKARGGTGVRVADVPAARRFVDDPATGRWTFAP